LFNFKKHMKNVISIAVTVKKDLNSTWKYFTGDEHVIQWNFATPDWYCPRATSDFREGGTFTFRMEAKDGSFGFDFGGTYTKIVKNSLIEYKLGDDRTVRAVFSTTSEGTRINEEFDAESVHPPEQQRAGWQSILNNFKTYAESR
jgi:uncharacterized protein YndB with AHSA1/START domain